MSAIFDLELRAEALTRSPQNLDAALRFYDDALRYRLALFDRQPTPANKLAQARNQLQAALWLLDCAVLYTELPPSVEYSYKRGDETAATLPSEALKRMNAAAASISTVLKETPGMSDDPEVRRLIELKDFADMRLIVLKHCAEAESRLLARAPAEALAFLDKALCYSRLINDFDQDRLILHKLLMLNLECMEYLLDLNVKGMELLGGRPSLFLERMRLLAELRA